MGQISDVPDDVQVPETAGIKAFPVIEHRISSFTFIRIATFVFLALEISFGALQRLLPEDMPWVGLTMLGIFVGWLDVLVVMYIRSNIIKLLTVEAYVAVAVNIYVDHMTGLHGWSYSWVVPALLLGLGVITVAIALLTNLRPSEYVTYIVVNTAASLLQYIPIRLGLNPLELPAVIVTTVYLIFMAGMIVFRFRDLKTALGRRFSV